MCFHGLTVFNFVVTDLDTFTVETMMHYARGGGAAIVVFIRRKKLFPTTEPMTEPMIAPATNSENQWMVTETPIPT